MKMKAAAAILTALLLASCCARKAEAVSSSSRHADTVATLRSLSARTIDRRTTTETIVMRPDSMGRMVPVSHVIVRHTDKTEDVTADTSDYRAEAEAVTETAKAETATPSAREGTGLKWAVGVTLWLMLAVLIALEAVYLYKRWTSRD